MQRPYLNKTFFKYLLGFAAILLVSFGILLFIGTYGDAIFDEGKEISCLERGTCEKNS